MKHLTTDARQFVQGVVRHLKREGKGTPGVPKVEALLHKMSASARREDRATVSTTVVLTSAEKQRVADLLSQLVGRPLSVSYKTDARLIGGLRIEVGDWLVDSSLSNQVEHMVSAANTV